VGLPAGPSARQDVVAVSEPSVAEAREEPAGIAGAVETALGDLVAAEAVERLWNGDHTLWQDDPREVADRLGWLHSPAEMDDRVGEIESFADGAASNGITRVVVVGMGGSSLFPEVMASTFTDGARGLPLHVLDSTDPAAVARIADTPDVAETLFVVASKSGTTIETRSHLDYFWNLVPDPSRFVAITDPGTPLAALARDRGFRAVIENRPDIGGRFSALSHFGLVPAALVGVDLTALLAEAHAMLAACRRPVHENPGARLAAFVAAAARSGRDKLTFRIDPTVEAFGSWLEQLLAESTGKNGRGILPVTGEPARPAANYGPDRVFATVGRAVVEGVAEAGHPVVGIPLDDPHRLGGEVVRWEVATALAGYLLGVNPFDQPDVTAAKEATSRVLDEGLPEIEEVPLVALLELVTPGDYLAVQAYVDPGSELAGALTTAAYAVGERFGVATTVGIGPRYLHSTGQFHKGGPSSGVFVQVVGDDPHDVEIPGRPYGFSMLKQAQAAGDLLTLHDAGLRAGRVTADALLDAAR